MALDLSDRFGQRLTVKVTDRVVTVNIPTMTAAGRPMLTKARPGDTVDAVFGVLNRAGVDYLDVALEYGYAVEVKAPKEA